MATKAVRHVLAQIDTADLGDVVREMGAATELEQAARTPGLGALAAGLARLIGGELRRREGARAKGGADVDGLLRGLSDIELSSLRTHARRSAEGTPDGPVRGFYLTIVLLCDGEEERRQASATAPTRATR
jgi:hypothetical protein